MEVYAGYSENADYNVGRVIDAIDELGELDNTLILWIWGDNGASMEGTITGSFNELTMQNGIPLTEEMQLQLAELYGGLEQWGAAIMDPHYGAAWAWAGNTPFQWGKQVGSHLGGTRNPLVVHWPDRIHDIGGLRSQFAHVIDVAPTILDIAGIPVPETRRRHRTGTDARHHVRRVAHRCRRARTPHPAVLRDRRQPRHVQGRLVARDEDRTHPVGAHPRRARRRTRRASGTRMPDPPSCTTSPTTSPRRTTSPPNTPRRSQELKALFWEEAERYKVLPLLGALSTFFGILPPIPEETTFEFRGDVQNVMPGMIPRIYNRSYAITADLVVPEGGAEGVIVAEADHLGGFTLYVKDGKLTHTYSMMGVFIFTQVAEEDLPTGDVTVRMEFAADGATPATGGEVTLYIDDRPVGKGTDGPHRADPVLRLRRDGHRPRQRRRRRPRLRGQEAVRVHGHREEGDVRHQAAPLRPGRARPPRRRASRRRGARTVGLSHAPACTRHAEASAGVGRCP